MLAPDGDMVHGRRKHANVLHSTARPTGLYQEGVFNKHLIPSERSRKEVETTTDNHKQGEPVEIQIPHKKMAHRRATRPRLSHSIFDTKWERRYVS